MRVLLTGGTGFLGGKVLADLLDKETEVVIASRSAGLSLPSKVSHVDYGSLLNGEAWQRSGPIDAFVHLAAYAHRTPRDEAGRREVDRVNHVETEALVTHALAAGVSRVLFTSTIGVLGSSTPDGSVFHDESPINPQSVYAVSKANAEEALRRACGDDADLVILRPPLVCGAGAPGNLAALAKVVKRGFPLPFGRSSNCRSLVSVDALSAAIGSVLERWRSRRASGTFLVCDAKPLSTREICEAIGEGMGRRARFVPVPESLVRLGLSAVGRRHLAEQVYGDLEIRSQAFADTFDWQPAPSSVEGLRELGASYR